MLGSAASGARGTDAREPSLSQVVEEVPASAKGKGGKGFRASVPVYFHVVTPDGVTGNVTLAQIREQIRVMNAGFSGAEGGYDTGFRFTLAGVDRTVNAEWYFAGPTTSGERAMKRALKQGGANALNYYSTTAGAFLGWAYFPNIVENATSYLDGIVVDWESMPRNLHAICGAVRPRQDGHARGRPLDQPPSHVQRRLQPLGGLRRGHPGAEHCHVRLPDRAGQLRRAGSRPDPQLHGLLVRLLLQPVHARPGRTHAGCMAALARVARRSAEAN